MTTSARPRSSATVFAPNAPADYRQHPSRGSTNTAALRTAAALAAPGISTDLYVDLAALPAFNPDPDPLPHSVADLRRRIAGADAILFCTPEYAGGICPEPSRTCSTVGGNEIQDKPVAWLNVSSVAAPTGGADAHRSLEKSSTPKARIAHDACFRVPVNRTQLTASGLIDSSVNCAMPPASPCCC